LRRTNLILATLCAKAQHELLELCKNSTFAKQEAEKPLRDVEAAERITLANDAEGQSGHHLLPET
jgi:hypothetical protein